MTTPWEASTRPRPWEQFAPAGALGFLLTIVLGERRHWKPGLTVTRRSPQD